MTFRSSRDESLILCKYETFVRFEQELLFINVMIVKTNNEEREVQSKDHKYRKLIKSITLPMMSKSETSEIKMCNDGDRPKY